MKKKIDMEEVYDDLWLFHSFSASLFLLYFEASVYAEMIVNLLEFGSIFTKKAKRTQKKQLAHFQIILTP